MTCDEIERGNVAEDYLLGRLPERAAAEFEEHYFECPLCRERVELLEATRQQLRSTPAPAAVGKRLRRTFGALAAAAVVVIAVGIMRDGAPLPESTPDTSAPNIELPGTPSSNPGSSDLRALGTIVPPRFDAPRLRSTSSASRRTFLQAMERYERGDYEQAVEGLRGAVDQDPKSIPARFFLAVSYLQLERNSDGVEHLREVVRLGESAYLEDAHYFLAKAHIRQGDLDSARKELQAAIALDGDRRAEASQLLSEIR